MFDPDQLRCERCGGTSFEHFERPDGHGETRWWNRCTACGDVSEYMPTLDEIRSECLRIRAEQNAFEVDDDAEKFWRRVAQQMQDAQPDEPFDALDEAA